MSILAGSSTPYAEAETPTQMHADCRAVGARLRIPAPRAVDRAAAPVEHPPTQWQVSDRAAHLASGLHLHLD
ncbi:hypothetical protein [Nocardioides sp. AE5]|uniref:hypothetical protein n=1 Tax=Nocardioides sp. AE5 TaxID=2962573 RepID=UPI0028822CA4|nr:hypothetical protein [Nocardioides sp. AE5]MDT0201168.1 hypothetical protein [Nocardioides sp. AE5]